MSIFFNDEKVYKAIEQLYKISKVDIHGRIRINLSNIENPDIKEQVERIYELEGRQFWIEKSRDLLIKKLKENTIEVRILI
jgi:hypothetical protein